MPSTIHQHRWHPTPGSVQQNRGVYLLHGIGEHGGRYHRLAVHLTELGYEVAAHDHPGHGRSSGKRGVLTMSSQLELTAAEQFEIFANETGSTPFLFGHSLGGLVATSMVLNHKVTVAGLLLSAPAYAPLISSWNQLKLSFLNTVAPRFNQQLPYHAHFLTHDKQEQELGRNDPLNHRYKSASIVSWLVNTGQGVINQAASLNAPTLILIPGEDAVIDTRAIHEFVSAAPEKFITKRFYADFRHEILNETPERRKQVLVDVQQWLSLQ